MWQSEFIKKLQNRPDHERKGIVVCVSAILIVAVISIWTIQLKHTLRDYANTADISTQEQKLSRNAPSPLAALFTTTAYSTRIFYDKTRKQIAAVYEELYGFIKTVRENEQQLNL